MNEILLKRIAKEAHKYIQSDAVAPENMQLAFGDFINGAKWALQNQWISVEEALPEDCHSVFVRYMHNDIQMFSTGDYEETHDEWYVDGFGYNANVTHWCPIPQLEGGEE